MSFHCSADLHLGHERIIEFCNRPFKTIEKMDNTIITNYNKKIKEKDTCFIIGDFALANIDKVNYYMNALNGKKILIMGNHDHVFLKNKKFINKFEEVHTFGLERKFNNVIITMCHYPMMRWNKSHYGAIHLYGHVHNSNSIVNLSGMMNVGQDVNNFFPFSFKEIIEINKDHIEKGIKK